MEGEAECGISNAICCGSFLGFRGAGLVIYKDIYQESLVVAKERKWGKIRNK